MSCPYNTPSKTEKSANREENIHKEQLIAENQLKEKNVSDDKVTHNMLKIAIALNVGIIFFNIYLITISNQIVKSDKFKTDKDLAYLGVSIRSLTLIYENQENEIISIFCIDGGSCAKKESCSAKIDFNLLSKQFNIECSQLRNLKYSSIIYLVFTCIGNLMTFASIINIICIVYEKISLNNSELINVIARWDALVYLLNFIIYCFVSELVYSSNIHLGGDLFFIAMMFILAIVNFFCVKSHMSQLIRIKSRSSFIEQNVL